MNISFHLNFNGDCQQAFEYYAEHIGGKIGTMLLVKDSPESSLTPSNWQDKVVHANIKISGVELAGTDLRPEQYQKPKGFCILLGVKTEVELKAIFSKLSVDGEVLLTPQKTFWSECYGIVVDRFGIPWKVNCGS